MAFYHCAAPSVEYKNSSHRVRRIKIALRCALFITSLTFPGRVGARKMSTPRQLFALALLGLGRESWRALCLGLSGEKFWSERLITICCDMQFHNRWAEWGRAARAPNFKLSSSQPLNLLIWGSKQVFCHKIEWTLLQALFFFNNRYQPFFTLLARSSWLKINLRYRINKKIKHF